MLELERYSYTRDNADFRSFQKSLDVFEGDRSARHALEASPPGLDPARNGFIGGNNAPEDVHSPIWFFLHLRDISYMRDEVAIRRQADNGMQQLESVGNAIHADFASGRTNPARAAAYHL